MIKEGLLCGVRVLDLTRAYAGPFCGQRLADLGAEVIKIEPPIGETARMEGMPGGGPAFQAVNRSKKSMVLDLWSATGKEAFYELVKISDVVLDNWRSAAVLKRAGADYDSLKKINPRIISASIAGYGSTGPYSDFPSFDGVALAMSGMASLSGNAGEKPLMPNPGTADTAAGLILAIGIVTALFERERSGEGKRVEVDLLGCTMTLMQREFQHYFATGHPPERQGSTFQGCPPMGFYKCKDGNIALGPCWPKICQLIDKEWIADDPRFIDDEGRRTHARELESLLDDSLQERNVEEWIELFLTEGIVCSRVNSYSQALQDPQVIANKIVNEMEHPIYGKTRSIACPVRFVGAVEGIDSAPADLGEHTDEVLRNILGYSDEMIAELKKDQEDNYERMQEHARKLL
ncbi:MAG: CoA transferase [Chloroflexota bacterium]|nr:CoA transferase [Chloroflexota bacterium]